MCRPRDEDSHREIEEELTENREGKVNGGKARTEGMTPEERSELGRKAAMARWG